MAAYAIPKLTALRVWLETTKILRDSNLVKKVYAYGIK